MPSPRYNEKTALKEIEIFQSKIDNIDKRNPNKSHYEACLLYTSPSPRDQRGTRMPSSA